MATCTDRSLRFSIQAQVSRASDHLLLNRKKQCPNKMNSVLCVIPLFLATLVVRGADGEALATTDKKSCCLTTSLRGTLLAAAIANPSVAGADGMKDSTRSAPNVSARGWPAKPWPEGMVWIPGGEFWKGSDEPDFGDARPWHRVDVDGFWMDKTELTNEQFEKFVKATGYVTIAERKPTKEQFPTAPEENLVAGSVVFTPPNESVPFDN